MAGRQGALPPARLRGVRDDDGSDDEGTAVRDCTRTLVEHCTRLAQANASAGAKSVVGDNGILYRRNRQRHLSKHEAVLNLHADPQVEILPRSTARVDADFQRILDGAARALADKIDQQIFAAVSAADARGLGLSVRLVREFDSTTTMPALPDGLPPHAYVAARKLWESVHPPERFAARLDVLYGFGMIRPNLVARIAT